MGDAGKTSRENRRKEKQEEAARKREASIQEREAAMREREKKGPYRNFAQLNREKIPHLDRACSITKGWQSILFLICIC